MSSGDHPGTVVAAPRMTGRVRRTATPRLRKQPDPQLYLEHATEDGRRVFIAHRVLDALAQLEREKHPDETAGLLFGALFEDDARRPCAVVNLLIRPEGDEVIGTRATVTITAEGASAMVERAQARDPLLRPVGWGHTHPCFEAYFSGTDLTEQARWTEPASVGLVISGLDRPRVRHCVFVGPDSTPAEPVAATPTRAPAPVVSIVPALVATPPPTDDAPPATGHVARGVRRAAFIALVLVCVAAAVASALYAHHESDRADAAEARAAAAERLARAAGQNATDAADAAAVLVTSGATALRVAGAEPPVHLTSPLSP